MCMHADITYNKYGVYMPPQNSQAENTPTIIITIGDSRELKWQKRNIIKNPKTS